MTTAAKPTRAVRCPVCFDPLMIDADLPEAEVERRLAFLARLAHGPRLANAAGVEGRQEKLSTFTSNRLEDVLM